MQPKYAAVIIARALKSPSRTEVLTCCEFTEATRHRLLCDSELMQVFEPELSELQHQVLRLLGVSGAAYLNQAPGS